MPTKIVSCQLLCTGTQCEENIKSTAEVGPECAAVKRSANVAEVESQCRPSGVFCKEMRFSRVTCVFAYRPARDGISHVVQDKGLTYRAIFYIEVVNSEILRAKFLNELSPCSKP